MILRASFITPVFTCKSNFESVAKLGALLTYIHMAMEVKWIQIVQL